MKTAQEVWKETIESYHKKIIDKISEEIEYAKNYGSFNCVFRFDSSVSDSNQIEIVKYLKEFGYDVEFESKYSNCLGIGWNRKDLKL